MRVTGLDTEIDINKIKAVAQQIGERFQPEKIILFGSWAWSNPTPDSDVDFFIVKETDNTRRTAIEISGSIFPRPFPIDIIVYSPAGVERAFQKNDFFIKMIMDKGKILYVR